ncbi:MAG TPA: flippase [Candidatus Nanoarchaeia archaeon]|nr:flippase [Candidatus Nanoarchaeia archaeon]
MPKKESAFNRSLSILAKSSMWVFVGIIISRILGYAYRIIVARYYGPEVYGLLTLSLTIVGWFALFSLLGLDTGVLRHLSFYSAKKHENKTSYIVKFFMSLLLITGIVAGALLFIFSDLIAEKIFSNSQLSIFLKLFSLTIPLTSLKAVLFPLMQVYGKYWWVLFASKILDPLVKVITLVTLIFLGVNSINVPLSFLLAAIFVSFFAYLFCRISFKKIFKIKPRKDRRLSKEIISYSWPLLFFALSMFLFHQEDLLIIGILKTVKDVGFYSAAVPISLLLVTSISLFSYMFFPVIAQQYSKGNKKIVKQLSQQTGKWVYMLSLPLFILFIIFPGVFIKILFGEEYLVATNALRFLSIGAMFANLSGISNQLLSIQGKSKLILKDTLFVLVLNAILNLILIPVYGITGAAIATMISFIFLGLIFAFQSWKLLGIIPLRRKMINITIVTLIPTGLLLLIKEIIEINLFTLIILGILFISLYVLLIMFTGCLDKNDKLILDLIKKKISWKTKSESSELKKEQEDL